MANFAQITNGYVTQVVAVSDSDCWILTDITGSQRYNYAGIGFTYDAVHDAFVAPKPFPSWVLDENVFEWFAPVPRPSEGGPWSWDEETLSWKEPQHP